MAKLVDKYTPKLIEKWTKKVDSLNEYHEEMLSHNQNLMNDWELEFIDSISHRLSSNMELSWNQAKKLNQIYTKYREQ